jgi:hypothetical protein
VRVVADATTSHGRGTQGPLHTLVERVRIGVDA